MKTKLFFGIIIIGLAFVLYLLSLLEVVPLLLSIPLLFGAIFVSVSFITGGNRFKGFKL